MTLYEVIQELVKAGHDDICYNKAPMFPGSWLHPKIVSRDGRVIADRIAKPNDWSLCSVREKAVLDAILPGGDDALDKKRL